MEEYGQELKTIIKVCFFTISSICYCYLIPLQISNTLPRLLSLLPIITLFSILPLQISTVHLAFPAFFFLVWLGNFKLLLLAFNRGPLSSKPRLPLPTFICVALLPINIKQCNNKILNSAPSHKPIMLAFKAMILTLIIQIYHYKDSLHWIVILALYFTHMHIGFELGFALTAYFAKLFLAFGFEIEPQFNEPFVATSLQDFWGRRWNLAASSILRASVYDPIRAISTATLGRFWSQELGIMMTFLVSGLMHELMFFYMMRVLPTWEVTWFFVLQGVCVAVEVAVKKAVNDRFRLHRIVSWLIGAAYLLATGWLFFVQPIRNGTDVKVINESAVILKYLGLIDGVKV